MANDVVFKPAVDDPLNGTSVDHGEIIDVLTDGEMHIKVKLSKPGVTKIIRRYPSAVRAYDVPLPRDVPRTS